MTGRNIASERVRMGLTQAELARKAGVSATTVASWESGRYEPTSCSIKRLALIFGCSTDYLLGMTDERKAAAKA